MANPIPFLAYSRTETKVKACATCRHVHFDGARRSPSRWQCGVTGRFCASEINLINAQCGPERYLWEARFPGFWTRLGDAIIERIRRGGKGPAPQR